MDQILDSLEHRPAHYAGSRCGLARASLNPVAPGIPRADASALIRLVAHCHRHHRNPRRIGFPLANRHVAGVLTHRVSRMPVTICDHMTMRERERRDSKSPCFAKLMDGLRGQSPIALVGRRDKCENEGAPLRNKVAAYQPRPIADDDGDLVHLGEP